MPPRFMSAVWYSIVPGVNCWYHFPDAFLVCLPDFASGCNSLKTSDLISLEFVWPQELSHPGEVTQLQSLISLTYRMRLGWLGNYRGDQMGDPWTTPHLQFVSSK